MRRKLSHFSLKTPKSEITEQFLIMYLKIFSNMIYEIFMLINIALHKILLFVSRKNL